jgi:hypothetical protein
LKGIHDEYKGIHDEYVVDLAREHKVTRHNYCSVKPFLPIFSFSQKNAEAFFTRTMARGSAANSPFSATHRNFLVP